MGLAVLKHIASFCEENGINYVLSDGTLIGAVRHKGFIPWDLDIDISMLRPDYERFIGLWKDTADYALVTIDKVPECALSFAKIVDKHTIAYEHGMKSPLGGIWVDVFPLDAVPDDVNEIIAHNSVVEKKWKAFNRLSNMSRHKSLVGKVLRRIKYCAVFGDFSIFWENPSYRYKKLITEVSKYQVQEYKNVTNYMVIYHNLPQRKYGFPKTALTDFIYTSFEDAVFRIPKDYDSMLKSYYGDYMTPPPVEEQKDHHGLEVFRI